MVKSMPLKCDCESNSLHILDLALRQRWSSVADRAATHPSEIAKQDRGGFCVFHWACANDAPPNVIRALLEHDKRDNCGRGIHAVDRRGLTALMVACSNGDQSLELVQLILDGAPELLSVQDNDGWTALHYVCSRCDKELIFARTVAELMLKIDPSVASLSTSLGESALLLACRSFSPHIKSYLVGQELPAHLLNLWVFASAFTLNDEPISLRSILDIPDCPLLLIQASIRHFPHSLTELDDTGQTSLHYACMFHGTPGTIQSIVRFKPETARIQNAKGEFPLAVAARRKLRWGVDLQALLDAHPAAVETLQVPDTLYPRVFARVDSSTIFELLLCKPSIVHCYKMRE